MGSGVVVGSVGYFAGGWVDGGSTFLGLLRDGDGSWVYSFVGVGVVGERVVGDGTSASGEGDVGVEGGWEEGEGLDGGRDITTSVDSQDSLA